METTARLQPRRRNPDIMLVHPMPVIPDSRWIHRDIRDNFKTGRMDRPIGMRNVKPRGKVAERMGIEPTRSLFPDPSPVLKTGPGTSHGRAPRSVRKRQNTTVGVGTPFLQGAGVHRFLNSRSCYHVRKRQVASNVMLPRPREWKPAVPDDRTLSASRCVLQKQDLSTSLSDANCGPPALGHALSRQCRLSKKVRCGVFPSARTRHFASDSRIEAIEPAQRG